MVVRPWRVFGDSAQTLIAGDQYVGGAGTNAVGDLKTISLALTMMLKRHVVH